MKLLFAGTYDANRPRCVLLREGALQNGAEVIEVHASLWGTRDKSQAGARALAGLLLRYPFLVLRLALEIVRHRRNATAVVIPYLGNLDIFWIAPLAWCLRLPVILDAFISLYDTVVNDRKLVESRLPAAALYVFEYVSLRLASRIIVDTASQGAFFAATFHLPRGHFEVIPVGAEKDFFISPTSKPLADPWVRLCQLSAPEHPLRVLYYGLYIPLHGIETILSAAAVMRGQPVVFLLVGKGQLRAWAERRARELKLMKNVVFADWLAYPDLISAIQTADVCLGVFGDSEKAGRVVPNKVFQSMAIGTLVVTEEGPGMREWFRNGVDYIGVPPAHPVALAAALKAVANDRRGHAAMNASALEKVRATGSAQAVGRLLVQLIERVASDSS